MPVPVPRPRRRNKVVGWTALLGLTCASCWFGTETENGTHDPQDARPTVDASAPGAGTVAIYLTGDLSPKNFEDGLAGQTPTDFFIGVSAYFALTSLDDPSPVLCFDHGNQTVEADMHRDNLVGFCETQRLPTAVYTHGRVKVEWVRYTVSGTLHRADLRYPGQFTFFRACSDTHYDGQPYLAGQGTIAFAGETEAEFPATYDQIQELPGISLELVDGEFWMTFPFSRPLPVRQGDTGQHWARFHWEIHEGFRWQDADHPGHETGVWDVDIGAIATEPVVFTGATGYHTTASSD